MNAYYNEIDPYAAQWLRNLIAAGHIAPGDVDERSIADVRPDDLRGYAQCHFFAGIGGWSYALRLAGWPDARPVWTGSCPCQPFSAAGKGKGTEDSRHLWPEWFRLIRECRPVTVFGEQVSAAIRHSWLDLVSSDLEGLGYAVGAAVVGAHSVGAPHIRQRLYWVAESQSQQRHGRGEAREWRRELADGGSMGDANDAGSQGRGAVHECAGEQSAGPSGLAGFWRDAEWLPCRDGKARSVEPGIFPLAYGVSGGVAVGCAVQEPAAALSAEEAAHIVSRVGVLRGAGNAIVPQIAAEVIAAYMESKETS